MSDRDGSPVADRRPQAGHPAAAAAFAGQGDLPPRALTHWHGGLCPALHPCRTEGTGAVQGTGAGVSRHRRRAGSGRPRRGALPSGGRARLTGACGCRGRGPSSLCSVTRRLCHRNRPCVPVCRRPKARSRSPPRRRSRSRSRDRKRRSPSPRQGLAAGGGAWGAGGGCCQGGHATHATSGRMCAPLHLQFCVHVYMHA